MYESFYGFCENPFQDISDPDFLYPSKLHIMALAQLEYSLSNQIGFSIITGDTGTGKTLLIRALLNHASKNINIGLISSAYQPSGKIAQWILAAFDLSPPTDEKSTFQTFFTDFLIAQYAQGKHCVLIIDEAQELSPQSLEELRMLSNINADKDQIFQVILVGQNALRLTLRRPDMQQFAQRVAIDYHLKPLTHDETTAYIQHRCKIAGRDTVLFSDSSCQKIHTASQGIPRLINNLCNTALIYGYAAQAPAIDSQLTEEVIDQKIGGGLSGLRSELKNTSSTSDHKEKLPCVLIGSNNPKFAGSIQSLLIDSGMSITPSSVTLNKMAQKSSSADAMILESNIPESDIQTLLKQSQCPILFINEISLCDETDNTERNALSQSLQNKLSSLLTSHPVTG